MSGDAPDKVSQLSREITELVNTWISDASTDTAVIIGVLEIAKWQILHTKARAIEISKQSPPPLGQN